METARGLNIEYINFLFYFSTCATNFSMLNQRVWHANYATCSTIPELSTPQYWVSHHPYIVLVSKQPVNVNGFLPCHSGAHFLSVAPGWEHTMTNTTHISSPAGSQPDRQGDTGVICFCQKHRNSLSTPPGVDKAGMHSLASSGRDVLLLWLPASAEEGLSLRTYGKMLLSAKCHD